MPIYEYKCDNCGEVFEVRQRFSDKPVGVHDKCGGPVHRLLSAPSFQFKGSGWYATDYAKSGSKPHSSSSGDNGDKAKTDTPAKTESTSTSSSSDKKD
jgi:putative FmdB family regulatory protein